MRLFRHHTGLAPDARASVVALGNFDGVHKGHQGVIAQARQIARAQSAPLAVLTFEPHPRRFFAPDTPPFRLTPLRIKARIMESLGVDLLFVLHFDQPFSQMSAEDFIHQVLLDALAARHVVCGYDFVFGHKRAGNPALLERLAAERGVAVSVLGPVDDAAGAAYSSTAIRDHLRGGNPRAAAALLGYAWEIEGRVVPGDGRGRTLGFPTANVMIEDYLSPALGVYAVRAGIDEGAQTLWHDGVANFGRRPTFGGGHPGLEVHLFGFSGDLYGRHMRVAFSDYLRGEKKFDGVESLKAQIAEDGAAAKAALSGNPLPLMPQPA